jgi:hypothetical protein
VGAFRLPRWAILAFGAGLLLFGLAVSQGWIRDPSVARSDYAGTIDLSAADARLYRAVPFDWQVNGPTGSRHGHDAAWLRVDPTGESAVICGWLRIDTGSASLDAARWLSEARLRVGDLRVSALFIAPADKPPGEGLNAGCARLLDDRPAADAPLSLEGSPVRE